MHYTSMSSLPLPSHAVTALHPTQTPHVVTISTTRNFILRRHKSTGGAITQAVWTGFGVSSASTDEAHPNGHIWPAVWDCFGLGFPKNLWPQKAPSFCSSSHVLCAPAFIREAGGHQRQGFSVVVSHFWNVLPFETGLNLSFLLGARSWQPL